MDHVDQPALLAPTIVFEFAFEFGGLVLNPSMVRFKTRLTCQRRPRALFFDMRDSWRFGMEPGVAASLAPNASAAREDFTSARSEQRQAAE